MSTTKTTKYYVQGRKDEGSDWLIAGLDAFATRKDAEARAREIMPDLPAYIFRIARETITTQFTAYQPITNPAQP